MSFHQTPNGTEFPSVGHHYHHQSPQYPRPPPQQAQPTAHQNYHHHQSMQGPDQLQHLPPGHPHRHHHVQGVPRSSTHQFAVPHQHHHRTHTPTSFTSPPAHGIHTPGDTSSGMPHMSSSAHPGGSALGLGIDDGRERERSRRDYRDEDREARRKRARPLDDTALLPSNDRIEWYSPAARDPQYDLDNENDDVQLPPGLSTGNWGKKLVKGARWSNRGKIAAWGPAKAEWEVEDRARKRLKQALAPLNPPSPPSPPTPTLARRRSVTPPLLTPSMSTPTQHPNYTSFVLDPAIQHAFTSKNLAELEGTATELIEGEGALKRALGALWRAMSMDVQRPGSSNSIDDMDTDDYSTAVHNGEYRFPSPPQPLKSLFISPHSIALPGAEQKTILAPPKQIDSLEWSLGILRELADDGREYLDRLEEIREGLGRARGTRKSVWTACRENALEEMEAEDSID